MNIGFSAMRGKIRIGKDVVPFGSGWPGITGILTQ